MLGKGKSYQYLRSAQLINDGMMASDVKELFAYGDNVKCVKLRI